MTDAEHIALITAALLCAAAVFAAVLAAGAERFRRAGSHKSAPASIGADGANPSAIRHRLRVNAAKRTRRARAGNGDDRGLAFPSLADAFVLAGRSAPPGAAWMMMMQWLAPALAAAVALRAGQAIALAPHQSFVAAIGCAAAARAVPYLVLAVAIARHRRIIRQALPDAAALIGICLTAGLGLDQALKRTAEAFAPVCPSLARELNRTAWEMSLLSNRAAAFSGLSERVRLAETRLLASQLAQADRHGLPAAKSLQMLADDLREQRLAEAERRAARLPAVLAVTLVIFFLPGVLLIVAGPALLRLMSAG